MTADTVIYIGGFVLPDGNAAAQRVLANGRLLRALGYKVRFYGVYKSRGLNNSSPETDFSFDEFLMHQAPYPVSKKDWMRYLSSIKDIVLYLEKTGLPRIVAIIVYNFPAIAIARLRYYCRRSNILLIADCTEWYSAKGGGLLFGIIKALDTLLRMRIIHRKADGIICGSRFLYDYYKKRGAKALMLLPLVDKDDQKWRREEIREDQNAPRRFVYAGSPGSPKRIKDRIDLVVEALKRLAEEMHNFSMDIIGLTEEDYYIAFPRQNRLTEEILSPLIKFHGRLPHLGAIDKLKQADFMIFLRNENRVSRAGFPTKYVEALACGIPVITNATSNITDYLVDQINGLLVESLSIDNIAAVLRRALEMPTEHVRKMKIACQNDRSFDFRVHIMSAREFLEAIAANRRGCVGPFPKNPLH